MDNLLSLTLEAHHQENNHHRRYEVVIGRDMLDDWTVVISYGRTGQRGTEQHFASSQAEQMQIVVRARLQRRLSAPRRLGCAYRLTSCDAAPGFDSRGWLPGEIMARFFQPS
jgi:predicted DNA-binding WGR domain protein